MALDTYDGLKIEVADWLNKTNASLIAKVPTFITLAEAQMRREIKARPQVITADITLSGETYALPCGFDGMVSLRAGYEPLIYLDPDVMDGRGPCEGNPVSHYSISGETLYFSPVPSEEITLRMRYRALFCPLSSSNRCNWLLDKHPDAYLYGALMQAAPYLEDDARITTWSTLFGNAIAAINQQALHQQYGAGVQIQANGVV